MEVPVTVQETVVDVPLASSVPPAPTLVPLFEFHGLVPEVIVVMAGLEQYIGAEAYSPDAVVAVWVTVAMVEPVWLPFVDAMLPNGADCETPENGIAPATA